MTEKQVRDIVRVELKKMVKDEVDKAANKVADKYMTKKEVKDIIKKTMLKYHRWMWEKKGMWINQI